MPEQTRVLVVEDVPQVAQYIRGLLNAQESIRLLDVVADGASVIALARDLRPDVLLVDALLQGNIKGMALLRQLRDSGLGIPMVVLTVPQHPIATNREAGIFAVLSMPFTGFELIHRIQQVGEERARTDPGGPARVITVFAPKGGVGRTTIAYNLAVAISRMGLRTVLVDGSLQFADIRVLLKAAPEAPSILNLPVDQVHASDLDAVVWREPSGVDVLLAPPRIEMAEMVTPRDVEKLMSLLRQVYRVVIIDTSPVVNDINLLFLDECDTILEIMTYDLTTIHNLKAMDEAFTAIGYPPAKLRYLVNRSDSHGGLDPVEVATMLGRTPEHEVVSGGALVVKANNEGRAFVVVDPDAQISQDLVKAATEILAAGAPAKQNR